MIKGIKLNFKTFYSGSTTCQLKCQENPKLDEQSHLLVCHVLLKQLSPEERSVAASVKYNDIFGSVDEQIPAIWILARLLEIREDLSEESSLPVGWAPTLDPGYLHQF